MNGAINIYPGLGIYRGTVRDASSGVSEANFLYLEHLNFPENSALKPIHTAFYPPNV
jgi:hypothetical protein